MARVRTPRPLIAAAGLAALLGLAACSSSSSEVAATTTTQSPQAAYCQAWADLVTSFGRYQEIDVVNGGLDSVRTYFDQLEAAAAGLDAAADAQLKPSVDAFVESLEQLGTTITSGSLPVDRREQVRAAAREVDTAWNEMVTTFTTRCPGSPGTTVGV
jgi:ABC-type glycerol-3-phosphate transport system substrate-binding protein